MAPEVDDWTKYALQELGRAPDDAPAFIPAEHATASADTFYRMVSKSTAIISFLVSASRFADNAGYVAKKITDKMKDGSIELPRSFNPFESLEEEPGPFVQRFRFISDTLFEMTLVRLSDAFTSYLSDIIRECLTKRPEILRSKETITFELALSCDNMDELREVLVDRKVNELAYLGFPKLTDWIVERLGIEELREFGALHAITRTIELRNCIVHNGGRANQRYASIEFRPDDLRKGQKILIGVETIFLAGRATIEAVKLVDARLAGKFELAQTFVGRKGPN